MWDFPRAGEPPWLRGSRGQRGESQQRASETGLLWPWPLQRFQGALLAIGSGSWEEARRPPGHGEKIRWDLVII